GCAGPGAGPVAAVRVAGARGVARRLRRAGGRAAPVLPRDLRCRVLLGGLRSARPRPRPTAVGRGRAAAGPPVRAPAVLARLAARAAGPGLAAGPPPGRRPARSDA